MTDTARMLGSAAPGEGSSDERGGGIAAAAGFWGAAACCWALVVVASLVIRKDVMADDVGCGSTAMQPAWQ
jgi:hypothetical protein